MQFPTFVALLSISASVSALPAATPELFRRGSCKPASTFTISYGDLPAPAGTCAYALIGHGNQMYTCAGKQPTDAPALTGAQATLYDACILTNQLLVSVFNALPGLLMNPKTANKSITQYLQKISTVGTHSYDVPPGGSTTVPTFHVNGKTFYGAAAQKSPATINFATATAIQFVHLIQNPAPGAVSSLPVRNVYRVGTVGGIPPATCAGQPDTIQVPYAAEYVFYN